MNVQYGNGIPSQNKNWVFQKFVEIKDGKGNTKWGKDVTQGDKGWDPKTGKMIEGPIGDAIPPTVDNAVREGMEHWLSYLERRYVTYDRDTKSTKNRLTANQLHEAFVTGIFTKFEKNNTSGNDNEDDLKKMKKWKDEGFDLEGVARGPEGVKMMMQAKIKANQDPWCKKIKNMPCCSGPGPGEKNTFKNMIGRTKTRPQCKGGRRKSRRKSKKRKSKKKKRRRKRKRTKKRRR